MSISQQVKEATKKLTAEKCREMLWGIGCSAAGNLDDLQGAVFVAVIHHDLHPRDIFNAIK